MSKDTIPILDLHREYTFLKKEIDMQLTSCFKSQAWVLGKKVSEFEAQIASYLGVPSAIGVASGTDALLLSLSALALQKKRKPFFSPQDEIITTPFTFIATAEAIVRMGAKPVFVDIDPVTFNIDPEAVARAVTRHTVGIIPVHLFGLIAEMDTIKRIAKKNDLFIIEDAAQCFGATYKGKKPGAFGDCAAFSFFPSKNLGAYGDGGLIVTNKKPLADTIKILRNHGQTEQYNARYIGFNSRLDALQASVLLAKLRHIDKFIALRRKCAKQYTNTFKSSKYIVAPHEPKHAKHSYYLYTIRVSKKRDKLLKYLNSHGVGARVYYPMLLSSMKAFSSYKRVGPLPNAQRATREVLSLPIYPFITRSHIQRIIRLCQSFKP